MNVIDKASDFALKAHADQKYNGEPYIRHLYDIAAVLSRLEDFSSLHEDIVAAAWLHDVVEDTDITIGQIRAEFGFNISKMVDFLTKPEGSRMAVQDAYYDQLKTNPDAMIVKLADRIANVEYSWKNHSHQLFMYHDEYAGFRSALKSDESAILVELWDWLDSLMCWRISREKTKGTS